MKYDYIKGIIDYLKNDLNNNVLDNNQKMLYENYIESLKKLTDKLGSYYEPINGEYKKINEDDYKEFDGLFKDAINSSSEFIKLEDNGNSVLDFKKKIALTLNKEFLNEAYVEFQNVDINSNKSFKESMDSFREKVINLPSLDLEAVSGNLSLRTKISFVDDGREVNGFFTEAKNYDYDKSKNEAFQRLNLRYPRYKKFIDYVKNNEDVYSSYYNAIYTKENYGTNDKEISPNFIYSVLRLDGVPLEYQEIAEEYAAEEEFSYACAELAETMNNLSIESVNNTVIALEKGDAIDKRNVATSGVAHLLGVDKLIAKATPIRIEATVDGKTVSKQGTFMEFAKGMDLKNLKAKDIILHKDEALWDTKEGKISLANLQILDYICGNIDRHLANMFYDFDPETHKLKGVIGIDNDLSFLKGDVSLNGNINNFTSLNHLKVIDEEMASKVLALDEAPFKATLYGYGLEKKAIDDAWKRTELLKEAINKQMIYEHNKSNINDTIGKKIPEIFIVKNDDWNNLKLDDLGMNTSNIFNRVSNIPKEMFSEEQKEKEEYIKKSAILNGALKTKLDYAKGFLEKAREYKTLFGTSNRYNNFIKSLEVYNSSRDEREKMIALKDLKVNINTYKLEKIRDGVLDKDGNLLKNLTGKDLNRVNLVKEVDSFIIETQKLYKEASDINKLRQNDIKLVDDTNALLRKGKYVHYPKVFLNEEGKTYIIKDILNRDDATFKELNDYSNKYKNTNTNYIDRTVENVKSQLKLDYHHGRIPKEYYDYRLDKLDNRIFDDDSRKIFVAGEPNLKYFANEFQNQIKDEVDDEFAEINENLVQSDMEMNQEIDKNGGNE